MNPFQDHAMSLLPDARAACRCTGTGPDALYATDWDQMITTSSLALPEAR